MSALDEDYTKRLISPDAFTGTYRHACVSCGAVMVVPDPQSGRTRLTDGEIWACGRCRRLHEYYIAYGDRSRSGVVRALVGIHRRQGGEPTVNEFTEREPATVTRLPTRGTETRSG